MKKVIPSEYKKVLAAKKEAAQAQNQKAVGNG